jgi:RNA polymerase sigma factor (sigma-70 family)
MNDADHAMLADESMPGWLRTGATQMTAAVRRSCHAGSSPTIDATQEGKTCEDETRNDAAGEEVTEKGEALQTGSNIGAAPGEAAARTAARNERLTRWFKDWRGAMKRWLSSRSSVQAADLDDVAQEVFVRLMRYSDDAVVEYPQSYLFRIAANVLNEWRERARNCLPHDDVWLADLQIEPEAEPENAVEHDLAGACVRRAVNRLRPRHREVLLLHIKEDLTYKQIASRLALTPRVVRRDIARAYAQLRSELRGLDGPLGLNPKLTRRLRGKGPP